MIKAIGSSGRETMSSPWAEDSLAQELRRRRLTCRFVASNLFQNDQPRRPARDDTHGVPGQVAEVRGGEAHSFLANMNRCKTLGLLVAFLSFRFNVAAPVRAQATHAESPSKPAGITATATAPSDAIRFSYQPIDFQLETDETPERHAPETMAGGVAVFDYNNDGNLD